MENIGKHRISMELPIITLYSLREQCRDLELDKLTNIIPSSLPPSFELY